MADALVAVVLDHFVSIVGRYVGKRVELVMGVEKDAENLKCNLQAIHAVLEDAERRQLSDSNVRLWLEELKDVSYDMLDVLDVWSANAHVLIKSDIPTENKVCFSFLFPCFASSSRQVTQVGLRYEIAANIKKLNEKLQDIAVRKGLYNFKAIRGGVDEEPERPKTTSIIDSSEVRGRDEDKENLVRKLLHSSTRSPDGRNLNIVPVVGMGGIGKTTLAQLAYNHFMVKSHFDVRIWVCVSDPFDVVKVARAIIEQLTGQASTLVELESLLQLILKSIEDKKFLLVLDDVWTDDYQKWEQLKQTLKYGHVDSRVLVTTRKEEVAMMMGEPINMIHLKKLSEEDCWLLFSQVAFLGRNEEDRENLEQIGRTIATKCKGLPLAAKTLGSFMRFKKTKQQWEDVLHSEIWDLDEAKRNLFSPLLLSYYDLSPIAKRCFTYCAIFPKDELIDKDDLIQQWMSQGYFILKKNIEMEITGRECFDNLAMRSFFQDFIKDEDGNIVKCKMHDIVHEFAQVLTRNEYSITEIKAVEGIRDITGGNARHLTLMLSPNALIPVSILTRKKFHTLMVFCTSSIATISPDHFFHLKSLRTLNLSRCSIQHLPESIGELVHLRYLNLSHNPVEELPITLGNMCNLQTLKLECCLRLKKLPESVGKLICLRHIYISGSLLLDHLPTGICQLSSLRTMDVFIVADYKRYTRTACHLDNLRYLKRLQRIYINGLGNAPSVLARLAEFSLKKDLRELSLDFRTDGDANMGRQENLLKIIRPHPNLETLRIIDYCGGSTVSPSWMMSLTNLRRLVIKNCHFCEVLPPLGELPSLEFLNILNLDKLKTIGPEFLEVKIDYTGNALEASAVLFPKLKEVKFRCKEWWQWSGIPGWKVDSPAIIMPRLYSLKFSGCKSLEELPNFLQKVPLQNLIIEDSVKLQRCCQKGAGKEWHKICHIPNIQMF
ncbi:putative disease resistance protein RGA3 [Ziziphus jujuba]|uniref:Disease resistance protein RGA3 n=1 Tax=Ziziphus jujuba TaxID=326968 RepID=A0ABM3ZZQ5_ZIZJJ|nr:putative disease resistance protein RGA3 [Ziziphus jujuba]XP_060669955.1 putative disease resistance protein RGA3 [Ziziphus jujuba]